VTVAPPSGTTGVTEIVTSAASARTEMTIPPPSSAPTIVVAATQEMPLTTATIHVAVDFPVTINVAPAAIVRAEYGHVYGDTPSFIQPIKAIGASSVAILPRAPMHGAAAAFASPTLPSAREWLASLNASRGERGGAPATSARAAPPPNSSPPATPHAPLPSATTASGAQSGTHGPPLLLLLGAASLAAAQLASRRLTLLRLTLRQRFHAPLVSPG